jgi:DNA repair exonuclease SbcCD ATPase subunit
MKRTQLAIYAICFSGTILFSGILLTPSGYCQSKAQDRKDEQRENERVKRAEKEVNEAKRELAEVQKKLKEKLRSVDTREDGLTKTLRAYRAAEDDAEQEIGASIGIPSALAKVKESRKRLDEASVPVLSELHSSPKWKSLQQEIVFAKQEKVELNEDAELEDAKRDAKVIELNRVLSKPSEVEANAIQQSTVCKPLQDALTKMVEELEILRKKISRDKVQSHPKVMQASKRVEEAKKELAAQRKDLATIRGNAAKAMKQVASAQSELIKARVADAKDPNNGKLKNHGKGK